MSRNNASSSEIAPCRHCGTLAEGADFCCAGCEMAFDILHEAGLEKWYTDREDWGPRPLELGDAWEGVEVRAEAGGMCTARLAIDGLRCASCVWVTERLMERTEGVVDAHVSYATGRAEVRWDPERAALTDIVSKVAAVGYRPRPLHIAAEPDRDLLMRLGVAAFCTANLMSLTAAVYAGWSGGMTSAWADFFRNLTLILATPVATWSAAPFFIGAIRGARAGVLHMDVPISLAVSALYLHGVIATFTHADGYLDSMAMLVTLLLVGRLIEARGRRRVQEAVVDLSAQLPSRCRRIVGDSVTEIDPCDLRPGDQVEVPSGAEIPADGLILEGRTRVRMALLTGESEPVHLGPGDRVVAGGIVDGPPVRVQVTAAGDDALLGRMAEALERNLGQEERADALAPGFTAATLAAALLTAAWWMGTSPDEALRNSVAVLVVACPCALALARPLAGAAGLAAAARRGLLLRSVDALLSLADVRRVVLDKTGTLTRGVPDVIDASGDAIRIAAGLERSSNHPIARAILREAIARGIPIPLSQDVVEVAGVGLTGVVDGQPWEIRSGGPGEVLVEGSQLHRIRLRDVPRADARELVDALQNLGLEPAILTGDRREVAARLAEDLGISAMSGADPLEKAAWIEACPEPVLFVGDGLNDGPALAAASVGIAMGTGATASVVAADGVVAEDALWPMVAGLRIAQLTRDTVRRSRARAIAYNVVAVGLAAAGFIDPLVAAVLMPLSSLLVIVDASRLESRV